MEKKIINIIKTLKKNGKIIGLVHGVFDVIHVGHIRYFLEAKKKVDILIASLTDDKFVNKGPGKPIFNINQRVSFLENIKSIDFVVKSNEYTSVGIIKKLKPNYYFKGKDYKENFDITNNLKKEKAAIKNVGGQIIFTNSELFSSGKIINEKFDYIKPAAKELLRTINKKDIKQKVFSSLNKKNTKKILIIGDPILDIYRYVKPSGKSNKATIISTLFQSEKFFAGGTFLSAAILSHFCNNISIIQFSNQNNDKFYKKYLSKNIKKIKINTNYKIIKKIRYIDEYNNIKLFQTTNNEEQRLNYHDQSVYKKILKREISKNDYIFIFDYGYNSLSSEILEIINKSNKVKIINCQTNSYNFGYNIYKKYKNAELMCIDELEYRLGANNKNAEIESLLLKKNQNNYKNFIITMGKLGCYTKIIGQKTTFIPTIFEQQAKDTIGCGDVFITFFALLKIFNSFNMLESSILSHIAAAVHGNEFGNKNVITFEKFYKVLDNTLK
jgi:rfaE bifunctional protein nucleotidyltransferase chain/domain